MENQMKLTTLQEIFDFVVSKIIEQGAPSLELRPTGVYACYYRAERNGKTLKCAAGHLIADEGYRVNMEGRGADYLFSRVNDNFRTNLRTIDFDEVPAGMAERLVIRLQSAHDQAALNRFNNQTYDGDAFLTRFKTNLRVMVSEWNDIYPSQELSSTSVPK